MNILQLKTVAAVGAVTVLLAGCATAPAPREQMAVARTAVADADAAGAARYDAIDINRAHEKLNAATLALGARDYDQARRYAEEAEVDANLAATRTRSAKTQNAVAEVRESLRALRAEISRSEP
jgi:hypothetical protein